jgi:hypothetical protein
MGVNSTVWQYLSANGVGHLSLAKSSGPGHVSHRAQAHQRHLEHDTSLAQSPRCKTAAQSPQCVAASRHDSIPPLLYMNSALAGSRCGTQSRADE